MLKYLLRIAFSAEGPEGAASHKSFASRACAGSREEKERNQRSAPAAERKTRGRTGGPALLCPQREPTKGVRRQQKGSKKAGRAGRDRASALKTVPCRCLSAFPGRARLPTAKRGHSNATLGTRPRRSRLPAHSFGSCSLRRSECGLQARWTRSCSCWSRPGDR